MTFSGKSKLRVRFSPEDKDHGELHANVEGSGFSGYGSAWFSVSTIEDFCDQLGIFPLGDKNLPVLEGGYWENKTILSETHVSIRVTKRDNRGGLKMSVILCDADGRGVHTWFPTEYEDLSRFQLSLRHVLKGNEPEAALTESPA